MTWGLFHEDKRVKGELRNLNSITPAFRARAIKHIVESCLNDFDYLAYRQTDYPFIAKSQTDRYLKNVREAAKLVGYLEVAGDMFGKKTFCVPVCEKGEAVEFPVLEVMYEKLKRIAERECEAV